MNGASRFRAGSCAASARGFTLVELIVTLAISAALVAIGVPLGVNWAQSSRVSDAALVLREAFDSARALAIRNPAGADLGNPAAVLCVTSQGVTVLAGGSCIPGAAGTPQGQVAWQGRFPAGVALTLGGHAVNTTTPGCVALSSSVQALTVSAPAAAGFAQCASTLSYTLSQGGATVSQTLR